MAGGPAGGNREPFGIASGTASAAVRVDMTPRTLFLALLVLPGLACRSVDQRGFDLDAGKRDAGSDAAPAIDPVRGSDGPAAPGDLAPSVDSSGGSADAIAMVPADPAPAADAALPPPAPKDAAPEAPVIRMDAPPPTCTPAAEICDRKDNDCDRQVDEGFGVVNIMTAYSALSTFHGGCNALARFGPACNAAAHRFCVARGCHNTGFAPLENSGDTAHVGCVTGATLRSVGIGTLTTHHPGCGAAAAHSPACNAAINRYCTSQGFVTGFGPAEFDGQTSVVACLGADRATVVRTSYTVLAGHHPGCTAGGERFGPTCNAAINRFCVSTGARTGFGPAENSGDSAVVVCVKP
jgi:hypothetical protein